MRVFCCFLCIFDLLFIYQLHLIEAINIWKNNPNRTYDEGVQLFRIHANNEWLYGVLNKGESTWSRGVLFEELNKLSSATGERVSVSGKPPAKTTQPQNRRPEIDFTKLPPRLQKLNLLRSENWKEATYWFHRLKQPSDDPTNNAERKQCALKIEACFIIIEGVWRELDYFQKHGKELPEDQQYNPKPKEEAAPVEDFSTYTEGQLLKKRQVFRSQRSRAKKLNNTTLAEALTKKIETVTNYLNEK